MQRGDLNYDVRLVRFTNCIHAAVKSLCMTRRERTWLRRWEHCLHSISMVFASAFRLENVAQKCARAERLQLDLLARRSTFRAYVQTSDWRIAHAWHSLCCNEMVKTEDVLMPSATAYDAAPCITVPQNYKAFISNPMFQMVLIKWCCQSGFSFIFRYHFICFHCYVTFMTSKNEQFIESSNSDSMNA
jgi:hypothetical protein